MAPLLFGESIMFPFNDKVLQSRISESRVDSYSRGHGEISKDNRPKIKVEKDNDDYNTEEDLNRSVHLCNRCWSTFVGIEAYLAHRNNGCNHSQVFIDGLQRNNNVLDSVNRNLNDKDIRDPKTTNNTLHCSREIKAEPLDMEEIQKAPESINTQARREKENSSVNGGTCYINPNFPSAIQNIQSIYDHGKQSCDKVPQVDQDNHERGISKKRNLNVLSPEQSTTTLNIQPKKKIKMSESSKELSRELAEILRKQMSAVNNEYKEKQNLHSSNLNNHSESIRINLGESVRSSKELSLAESINAALQKQMQDCNKTNNTLNVNYSESTAINNEDSPNSDLIRKSENPISFHNKYSAAFNSESELTKNSFKQTKNITVNSSDYSLRESEENKTFNLKNSDTFSELTYSYSRSFEYDRKNEKAYNDCNAARERMSNFKSNTLVMYDLNINTRKEWLRKVFQRYGIVRSVKITRHQHVLRAKGYVEFEKLSDAEKAYRLCQNRIIDGSKIKIKCYHYSLSPSDSSPSCFRIGSGTTEFGKDYKDRSTGYPSRRPNYNRNKRPGPYNLF